MNTGFIRYVLTGIFAFALIFGNFSTALVEAAGNIKVTKDGEIGFSPDVFCRRQQTG